MKKSFLYLSFLTATSLSVSISQAMEDEVVHRDLIHDQMFQRMIDDHHLGDALNQHLRPATFKDVKIWDINELHERRSTEVHALARKKALDPVKSTSYVSALLYSPVYLAKAPFQLAAYAWNSLPNLRTPSAPASIDVSETGPSETDAKPLPVKSGPTLSFEGGAQSDTPEYLILGLMGGGLRARMEARWLEAFEKLTKRRTYEVFDQIGGTSAGGFLALGLTLSQDGKTPVKTTSELNDLIRNQAPKFFPQDEHFSWNVLAKLKDEMTRLFYTQYDPTPLENFLKTDFVDVTLGTALTRVFVTTVRADENEIYLLGNDSHPEMLGRTAGRATGAAPTYFPGVQYDNFTLVDGGVGANDPSLIAMMEVKKWAQPLQSKPFSYQQCTVVTFGTGDMPVGSLLSPDAGKLTAAAAVVEMAMSTNVNGTHRFIKETLPKGNYLYCNPKLESVMGLDHLSKDDAAALDEAAQSEMGKIEEWVDTNEVLRHRLERFDRGEQPTDK